MIMYILCSVIESIVLKTTCFAVTQTFKLGWNCSSYLLSQVFSSPKRNRKFIYLEDVIVHEVDTTRSKYIDYDDRSDSDSDSDSDDEYIVKQKAITTPCRVEMIHPLNESTAAFTMHDNCKKSDDDDEHDDTLLDKQVQIIKEIINDEKYLNIDNENEKEMKKKKELEEYLKNEYDKRVKEELDNEWVNIQVFE